MGQETAARIASAEKERQALDAALSGASFDAIAVQVGYANRGAAWKAVQRAIGRTVKPAADEYRQIELLRLDMLLLGLWDRAVAGDDAAVDRVLRIMQRRAKLLGLDAPVTIDVRKLVNDAARRHGLSPDESRVMFDRISDFLAAQKAGVS